MTTTQDNTADIRQAVQEHYGQRARRVIELTDVTPGGEGCGAENCGHGNCGADDCGYEAATAACCGPADTERAMTLYNEAQLQGLPWRQWPPLPGAAIPRPWPTCGPAKRCWILDPAAASTASSPLTRWASPGRRVRPGHDAGYAGPG